MNSAIIVAGGSSSRIKGDKPKQFIKIKGKEILSYSVFTFLKHPEINEVVIVSHPHWIDAVASNYPDCIVVTGGNRRQDSSLNGVQVIADTAENVLIHDAARPFISTKIISDCLKALNNCEGTAPIINPSNSLIQLDNGIATYLDRSKIREVQTPQCFKKQLILDVLSANLEATDEIGMVLKKFPKTKLKFVQGSLNNTKITTDLDLKNFSNL